MHNITKIEEYYKEFKHNLSEYLHENIIDINLQVLKDLDLLDVFTQDSTQEELTGQFHVVETREKITLISEKYIVWIIPDHWSNCLSTHVLIALNDKSAPKLEIAFTASKVYNTSSLVIRVLEKILQEIDENENVIRQLEKAA